MAVRTSSDPGGWACLAQTEQEHALAEERGHAAATQAALAAQLEDARAKLADANAAAQAQADRAAQAATAAQQHSRALVAKLQVLLRRNSSPPYRLSSELETSTSCQTAVTHWGLSHGCQTMKRPSMRSMHRVQGDVAAAESRAQEAGVECARLSAAHEQEVAKLRASLQTQVCAPAHDLQPLRYLSLTTAGHDHEHVTHQCLPGVGDSMWNSI